MRRRFALAALLACLVGAVAAAPASALVLGSKSFMGPYGIGWGTKKPKTIFNGGAPSGLAEHLRWRHWGESVATARGRIALYKPGGGYYARRGTIKLRAYAIGPCAGRRAYTRLSLSVPDRPGGPFGPWQPWAGATSLCAPGRVLAQLDPSSLRPIARLPRPAELKAIRRGAMRDCRPQEATGHKCKWLGHVKVSTIDSRYAWAEVSGPSYDNSGVLRRSVRHPRRWKMIRVVGGGIQPCSYWRRAVPPRVVSEFGIEGFTEGDQTFTYHPC